MTNGLPPKVGMTKAEFIAAIANSKKTGDLSKAEVKDVIDVAFKTIAKTLKKDRRFAVMGFGTFTVKTRKARKGRNPRTGEVIKIKASKTVSFKPASALKDSI